MTRPKRYTGRAPAIINHAVDNLLTADPKFHREPLGTGKDHKDKADEVEAWLEAAWGASLRDQVVMPTKQLAKHLTLYGYGILEGPLLRPGWAVDDVPKRGDFDSDADYDEAVMRFELQRSGESPFILKAPQPTSVLLHPMERIPKEALKREYWYAADLEGITTRRKKQGKKAEIWDVGQNPYERIECLEYWSLWWHALMTKAGQMLLVERNSWAFVPFNHGYAGWGHEPTDYQNMNPAYLARSFLEDAKDTLIMLTQHRISKHQVYMGSAWLKMRTSKSGADLQQQMQGDVLENLAEGEVGWLPFPDYPAWTTRQEQDYERDIELATVVGSLSGQRQEGVSTLGQQAILDTAASKKFLTPIRELEFQSSIAAGYFLRLVEVHGERLTINGQTIGSQHVNHKYMVSVKYEVVDPVLHLQVKQDAREEVQQGLESREGYARVARKENVARWRRELIEDKLWDHPAVVEAGAVEAAKGLGLESIFEEAALRQQAQQQPNGQPMGEGGAAGMTTPLGAPIRMPPRGPGAAAEEMRQPLTERVAKPATPNPAAFVPGGG